MGHGLKQNHYGLHAWKAFLDIRQRELVRPK